MKVISVMLSLVFGIILFTGCGGTSFVAVDPFIAPAAVAEFRFTWPADINILRLDLFFQNSPIGTQTVTRKPGETQAIVRFNQLYPNNIIFHAQTYRKAADSAPVKEGWGALRVRPNKTKVVTLAQDMPIKELLIIPDNPLLASGQSLQLAATLRDANGDILLDTPGAVTWTTDDASKVAVTASGKITVYQMGSMITAIYSATGISDTTTVNVPGLPGGQGLIAFCVNYDGYEELESGANATSADWNADIYVMNADGSNLRQMTTNFAADTYPSLSPNGRLLAFSSNRAVTGNYSDNTYFNNDIYIMNIDGSGQHRVISYGINPTFTSNGTKLAFVRQDGIYQANLNGSGITRLVATNAQSDRYVVSTDGTIYFTNNTGVMWNEELFLLKPGTNAPVQLTHLNSDVSDLYMVGWPTISPDGQTVAFARGLIGSSATIYLINKDGTNLRQITRTYGSVNSLAFSPDGTQLLVALEFNRGREYFNLNVLNIANTSLTNIAEPFVMDGCWISR